MRVDVKRRKGCPFLIVKLNLIDRELEGKATQSDPRGQGIETNLFYVCVVLH